MTLIPGTNREDGPCVVWFGTTIHGLDDVYGPFPNCADATAFIDQKVAEEWCSKENSLVLMLNESPLVVEAPPIVGLDFKSMGEALLGICNECNESFPNGKLPTNDGDSA